MAGNIVPGSVRTNTTKKGGRADLQALLVHTEHHPKGRVEIDTTTGLVKNPKNNVLFMKKMKIRVEGQVVGERDVPVNGGHAKAEGSVWRIPLAGPAKYHWMIMQDDYRYTYLGKADRTAPELTDDEMMEYQFFRAFLTQTNTVVQKDNLDRVNVAFYIWLDKQDKSKIELPPPTVFRRPAASAESPSVS